MISENDLLYQTARFYKDHLNNRTFELTIRKKNCTEHIEIRFTPDSFHHLAGLHKLKDIPQFQRSSSKVFHEILSGKLTYNDISGSAYLPEMMDRLTFHKEMFNIMNMKSLFFKSLHGYFKGIAADCVICSEFSEQPLYSFLFLTRSHNALLTPVSFFTRNEKTEYTKNGVIWQILSISEISRTKNKPVRE